MSGALRRGQTVTSPRTGAVGHVADLLGAGGQGEVYRAVVAGHPVALKWYFPHTATAEQRQAIEALVAKGPPDRRFLWPQDILTAAGRPGFGYAMPLREPGYRSLVDLMMGRADPGFRALCTAGFQLAESFLKLHARGLCYRDIAFGNVFFDPASGEVRICDNDNVGIDGRSEAGVLGTPRFMAPEVVRGEARPSTATDLWSLSVLLFYLLMVHHPLEGAREAAIKCLDLPAMTRLYGTHPRFIFHPSDRSNAPVPGVHDNALAYWPVYPSFLRELFERAFVAGLDPDDRVRESEWRGAMVRLRDAICYCQQCGVEVFYEPAGLSCWGCRAAVQLPWRIELGGHAIMLNHDARLYPHHVDSARRYDFSAPVAEMSRHPRDPRIWGLKNTADAPWAVIGPHGRTQQVPPGRSITLSDGLRLQLGPGEGIVRG